MSAGAERVLVVDDDEAMRRLIARMVSDAGHAADTAADAAEAREALGVDGYSLVICDLNMPGESGRDLLGWIRSAHRDVAILMATGTDDREVADAVIALGAYGYLVKPFKRNEVAINIANALRRRRLEIENREHRELLEQRVEERTAEIARLREETVNRLVLAIEFRSAETGRHVERIGRISGLVARRLGLDAATAEMIRVAAPLHDVGKIGIPDTVLLKPGPLDDEERRQVEQHAEIGHRLLAGAGTGLLELAAEIALTHHERYDGTGYPRRLAGEEIPLAGRITAVADVFDALTNDRVYRPALSTEDALAIIRQGRGTHFDPAVLDAFEASLDELL